MRMALFSILSGCLSPFESGQVKLNVVLIFKRAIIEVGEKYMGTGEMITAIMVFALAGVLLVLAVRHFMELVGFFCF